MLPFDPFQMMMERPIPKKNKMIETVDNDELPSNIIPIVISSKSFDREEILERLRETKNWITRCDIPLKYTEDSDYELEKDDFIDVDIDDDLEKKIEEEIEEELKEEEEEVKEEEEEVKEEEDPKEKKKRTQKKKKGVVSEETTDDLSKVKLGEWESHLPKPEKHIIKTPFFMNNRKKFIQNLNELFAKYRKESETNDNQVISCKKLRDSNSSEFTLLMHQKVVKDYLNLYTPYRGVLLYHGLGAGKCHKKDTPILMSDGRIKMVQDIIVGDFLMGDDSTPRQVMSLARGVDKMYDIISENGEKYTVNQEHILCLKASGFPRINRTRTDNIAVEWIQDNTFQSKTFTIRTVAEAFYHDILNNKEQNNNIIEIAVKDYLKLPEEKQKWLKGYKVAVDFPEKQLPFDPYIMGYLLGQQKESITITESNVLNYFTTHLVKYNLELLSLGQPNTFTIGGQDFQLLYTENRHIPFIYKCNSRENRLELLAGILDSNPSYNLKNEIWMNDFVYLVRSLGFEHMNISVESFIQNINSEQPDLTTKIQVKFVGQDDYYGFMINENCRYIMGDFTVTHNTASSIAIAEGFKTEKKIYVFLPASLKTNYWVEIQKTGDVLFKKNQYWEFVSTIDKPDLVPVLAKALNLTTEEVKKRNGVWMVDIRKEPNYQTLSSEYQTAVDLQIQEMIQNKYVDIHYNAPNLKKIIDSLITQKNDNNPFNHSVVVIDEAHNFISRIVGKLKVSMAKSIFSRLYHLLMDAEDCRIILLSGTPIINYPHEMAITFNLLRGYIKTWVFKVVISTNKEVSQKTILQILETAGIKTYDFIQYANNKLIITRNPFGFSNVTDVKKGGNRHTLRIKDNNAKTQKKRKQNIKGGVGAEMVNYKGVMKNPNYMTNPEFIKTVIKIMEQNGIILKPYDDSSKDILKPKLEKALYDNPDKFRETFLKEVVSDKDPNILQNVNVLKNRILGLTSYFRSAQEQLLPKIVVTEKGEETYIMEVPMSDYQFGKYAIIRKEEYEKEDKAAKRKRMAPASGNQTNVKDLFSMASSYRIFSRAACNFVFPETIERPRPPSKTVGEEEEEITGGEEEEEMTGGDGDDENSINTTPNYQKSILDTMEKLKQQSKNIFSKEKLRDYSPKFLEILNNIQNPQHEGLHLLYSNFRTLEGIGIFQLVLEENKIEEFKIQKKTGIWEILPSTSKDRYVLYTGTESEEQKEIIRNIYNGSWENVSKELRETLEEMDTTGKKNADGLIIKLFMITSAGAEGINLRNTRYVHIMEPYWHNVRSEQVIGRARRICSHEDLPENLRTVQVFIYLSVMSESQKKNDKYTELRIHDVSKKDPSKPITTDENLFEIAMIKTMINSQFLKVIKETAIDCSLYVAKHNLKEKTPLVCYGFGKVNSNEFSTYPILDMDLKDVTTGPEMRTETFTGKVVTVNGIKYALNPNTNELYNLVNYKNKILTFEGMYDPSKKEIVEAQRPAPAPAPAPLLKNPIVPKNPNLPKNPKMIEIFDLDKLALLDVKDNQINASMDNKKKSNPILLFFPTRLKPTFFPFITNNKELQLYVKSSCNIEPSVDMYEAKYNKEKFESPVYQNMQKKSILTSIDYVFQKMKMGVFIRIKNNVLINFIPLYNLDYVNDFSELLKFKDNMTAQQYFAKKDPKKRGKWNYDLSKWVATGCLLRNEADDDSPTLAYLSAFYDMMVETCHARKVNDCVFLLNRKDFPYLDKTWNESFDHIYGENVPMKIPWKNESFVPILSQSTSERHADIPIPTGDDWNNITQKYFAEKSKEFVSPTKTGFEYINEYVFKEKIPEWESRKPIFFWRGMGTGCGNSVNNNPRLKLTQMSESENLKSILDAGVTKFTRRDKKVLGQPFVEYTENTDKLVFKPKVDRFDQLTYKFTLNIEGNSAAYRFGSLFKFGFCILNVQSKYTLWFEPFLEDRVHCIFVKSDLSDLEETMKWCLSHDTECKKIAENARKFYDTYFTKDFVFDYLSDIFNKTSSMIGPNYQVDEQEIIRRKNDKTYKKFEFVSYDTIIKPEMDLYKKRYSIQYKTIKSTNKGIPNGTAIIVPFRENKIQNRAEQLQQFIRHYSTLNVPILIVTQSDDGYRFNRGALLNIGYHFIVSQSKKKIDQFIFHDVDLLFPLDFVEKYYGKSLGEIIHYGKNVENYYDYPDFLGGSIQFSKDAFQRINGFPNHIYGWGGEDDALKVRIASNKLSVCLPDEPKMKAEIVLPKEKETKNIEEMIAKHKNEDILSDEMIWKMNGLNSLHYKVINQTKISPGVFNIVVNIY